MPVSAMKFIEVKAPATVYHLLCFKIGGEESFFDEKGFRSYNYIVGIVLGPNSSLLIDTVGGHGEYATEKAGFVHAGDLATAWQYILRFFDRLQERGVLTLIQSADEEFGFSVESFVPKI